MLLYFEITAPERRQGSKIEDKFANFSIPVKISKGMGDRR